MEYLGALLEGQASRPAEHRRCALVSGEGFRSWMPPSPQTIANPPTTRSLTWNSKPSTEESTDGGELPPSFSEEFGGVLDGVS